MICQKIVQNIRILIIIVEKLLMHIQELIYFRNKLQTLLLCRLNVQFQLFIHFSLMLDFVLDLSHFISICVTFSI